MFKPNKYYKKVLRIFWNRFAKKFRNFFHKMEEKSLDLELTQDDRMKEVKQEKRKKAKKCKQKTEQ